MSIVKRDTRTIAKRAVKLAKKLGPLYVDEKYLEPGFKYLFASATMPGVMTYYERLGYEVVKKDIKVGDATPSTSSAHGSAVTVQSKCGQELVLMRIPQDIAEAIDEELLEEHNRLVKSLQNPLGIDEGALIGQLLMK